MTGSALPALVDVIIGEAKPPQVREFGQSDHSQSLPALTPISHAPQKASHLPTQGSSSLFVLLPLRYASGPWKAAPSLALPPASHCRRCLPALPEQAECQT